MTSVAELERRQTYIPDLAYEPSGDDRFTWITDHGRRVGLLDQLWHTLEWIAPHPGQPAPRDELPHVYHAPTYQGGRIVLQWWTWYGYARLDPDAPLDEPIGVCREPNPTKKPQTRYEFGPETGPELTLQTFHVHPHDERLRGTHRVRIAYDPLPDSYVANIEAELEAPDPYTAEYCNFLAGGSYDTRPAHKRYQCTIWAHPDGRLVRWPHNPVSYLTPGLNDHTGERRIADGGFLGYFTDPHTNPVAEILESTPGAISATCLNMYDEHLTCLPPGPPTDGLYHWSARLRMYSVKPPVAAEVVRRSELIQYGVDTERADPLRTRAEHDLDTIKLRLCYNPEFPPFYYGRVNDFETPVPYDQTVAGSFIWATDCPEHDAYWDRDCGHNGNRSIRLRSRTPGQEVRTGTHGPTPHLTPDTEYRLSGWIRCEDVEAPGAEIEFREIGMNQREQSAIHLAGPICGTCDWTYVEAEFRTGPHSDLGWLYLRLNGSGSAWFDEIGLEEV